MKFGEAIKKARDIAKLSQGELGDPLGWGQGRISNYESGKREPSQSDLEALSLVLGRDKNYLLRLTLNADVEEKPDNNPAPPPPPAHLQTLINVLTTRSFAEEDIQMLEAMARRMAKKE